MTSESRPSRRRALRRPPAVLLAAALLLGALALPRLPRVAQADSAPQSLPLSQDWSNTALITANDSWSGVPGVEGFLGQDLTTSTGADPQTILAGASAAANDLDVIANQTNPNTNNAGGVAEFHSTLQAPPESANPTVALNGSGAADAPYLLLHFATTGRSNVNVSYRLRDLDCSADNAQQQVALQYRVGGAGNFTNVAAGYVSDATARANAAAADAANCTLSTPVSVTLPAAADDRPLVQVRVITTNAAGNDEWVGVDDINITGVAMPTPTPSPEPTPATFTVNSTADTDDGSCDALGAGGRDCTLREAISAANANAGLRDRINFDLPPADPSHLYYKNSDPGGGPDGRVHLGSVAPASSHDDDALFDPDPDWPHSWWSIRPQSALPRVVDPVTIDGYSQPGAAPNELARGYNAVLRVELDGEFQAGPDGSGLRLAAGSDGSTVRGLAVNRFPTPTDANGVAGVPAGVSIAQSAANAVEGCLIGLDVSGTVGLPNFDGISMADAHGNRVGGSDPAQRNAVSGNNRRGLDVFRSDNNVVANNYVGTDSAGAAPVGNLGGGVLVNSGSDNLIGGAARVGEAASPGGNVISGNALFGVRVVRDGEGDPPAVGNRILGNSIARNAGPGIDLGGDGVTPNDAGDADAGPNNLQNYPVLSAATRALTGTSVRGTLSGAPETDFRIEFFYAVGEASEEFASPSAARHGAAAGRTKAAGSGGVKGGSVRPARGVKSAVAGDVLPPCDPSGHGEGPNFLGFVNVTAGPGGDAEFEFASGDALPEGAIVTATATRLRPAADSTLLPVETSEFSACVAVTKECPAITLSPDSLPGGTAGAPYGVDVEAAGPAGPYAYSVSSGSLPPGLTLDAASGRISGTPTTQGTFTFDITATNSASGCSAARTYSITVDPAAPACAADISGRVTVRQGGFRLLLPQRHYQQTITVTNISGGLIDGPVAVVLDNLTAGVTLFNKEGDTACAAPAGRPYKLVTAGGLAPGASANTVLQFQNAQNRVISYAPRTLSGADR